jgi:hypothetical protein
MRRFFGGAIEERVGGYGDGTGSLLHDNLEGCVKVVFGAGVQRIELESDYGNWSGIVVLVSHMHKPTRPPG